MVRLNDVEKYVDAWTAEQIIIWQEKIERLGVVRSGRLHESITGAASRASAGVSTIRLRSLLYGIYQAMGVGNGYKHGNGGDLQILNKDYREAHHLNKPHQAGPMPVYGMYLTSGKPRVCRDWHFKKLYLSQMAMVRDLGRILGEEAAHVVCEGVRK